MPCPLRRPGVFAGSNPVSRGDVIRSRVPYAETLLLSAAVILLEVSYTRVFSFKLFYYFTYLLIGIALLGLGAGAVAIPVSARLRRASPARLIAISGVVAGAATLLGYLVVARTQLNLIQLIMGLTPRRLPTVLPELAKLAAVCAALVVPFFAAGLALAKIFANWTERIGRLYAIDLVGAGLGCAVCVPLLVLLSPPGVIMLAGLLFALAGVRAAVAAVPALLAPGLVALTALAAATALSARLPDPVADGIKTMGRTPTRDQALFSRWNPVFRVDVIPSSVPSRHFLVHDGNIGSVLHRFDGDPASLASYEHDDRAYPFKLLGPAPRVAIIGAAGGNEILASLHFDAGEVTAVELNPVTVALHTHHFADFLGHLAAHPRVTMVTAEGRWFLAHDTRRYDLIWFVAPDSYASMNAATSGAFVLSESYLYTVEMIVESLESLSPEGLLCTQFGEIDFARKPMRTLRYLATAREAFRRLGIDDFRRHVLVATSAGLEPGTVTSTILLRRRPFTEDDLARFAATGAQVEGATVRYTWQAPAADTPLGQVIALPAAALAGWYRAFPYEVRPVTDDSPFFWHFVRFRDATLHTVHAALLNPEEGLGERVLVLFVVVAVAIATPLLLSPLVAIRAVWAALPHKLAAGLYFAALGLGFMFLEVSLIQRLTLFLGYPTYSLTVTLFALLLSTGLGSLLTERYAARRNRALAALAAVVLALSLFYAFAMPPLVARAVGWSLPARIALSVLFLAPLGLCLGAFMPLGLRTVAALTPHAQEYVAWSWAVNGFCSVVSSVLATILSMVWGFGAVMLLAAAIYLVGIAVLMRIPDATQGAR